MGSYLSKPKKTITVTEGGNNQFVYCTAEMQGWRQTQEVSGFVSFCLHFVIISWFFYSFIR